MTGAVLRTSRVPLTASLLAPDGRRWQWAESGGGDYAIGGCQTRGEESGGMFRAGIFQEKTKIERRHQSRSRSDPRFLFAQASFPNLGCAGSQAVSTGHVWSYTEVPPLSFESSSLFIYSQRRVSPSYQIEDSSRQATSIPAQREHRSDDRAGGKYFY